MSRERIPFHTPGHKGTLLDDCHLGELPVIDVPDDVCGFPGVLEKSQQMAANLLWTSATYYLVNGSTAGVQAMFSTILQPGCRVIVGRNLHMSVVSALVQTGAVPVYVPVEYDRDGIPLNVTSKGVERVARQFPDARAIFITSPSYFGVCADLEGICQVARRYRMHLLVDEAWGAHLPFGNGLPPSALRSGAGMVVHGAHKTLPVLTGGAMLHVIDESISREQVEGALSMVQTSSPNILFYLSLERAINMMKTQGPAILNAARVNSAKVAARIREIIPAFGVNFDGISGFLVDPLKLLVRTRPWETGITGYRVAAQLTERGSVIPEMADHDTVLFIFTGFEAPGDGMALLDELLTVYESIVAANPAPIKNLPPTVAAVPANPVQGMSPRDAYFTRGWKVPLHGAAGRVCRTPLVPYPPGVPVFLPGEIITGEGVAHLEAVIECGGVIRGIIMREGSHYADVI